MTNNSFAVSQPERTLPFRYSQCWWGESINGTKQELQALGIAPGLAFPGEPDGPKRKLSVTDPRGLPCEIARYSNDSEFFTARISYPDRARAETVLPSVYPGVTVEHLSYADLYQGNAEALIAAGLLRADQLPGMPGMGKHVARFLADGTVLARTMHFDMPAGAKVVRRRGKSQVLVYVYVSSPEAEQRLDRGRIETDAFERRMWSLPRPRPLVFPERDQAARQRRAQMRLVWSRPIPIPTLTLPPFKF